MSLKFLTAFLFLALALFLQSFFGAVSGIWIDFALAALVASAFSIGFLELLILVLCSLFVLNFQPALSPELLVFAALPFAAWFLHRAKLLPFEPPLVNAIALALALAVFYAIFGAHLVLAAPQLFLFDLAGSLAAGIVIFRGLESMQ